jgi:hypothetical protein
MNPQPKFHLVFSLIMAAMMVLLMTFVITLVNLGWVDDFVATWTTFFVIAYLVATPVHFFLGTGGASNRRAVAERQTRMKLARHGANT